MDKKSWYVARLKRDLAQFIVPIALMLTIYGIVSGEISRQELLSLRFVASLGVMIVAGMVMSLILNFLFGKWRFFDDDDELGRK
jgi:hypothetical protein